MKAKTKAKAVAVVSIPKSRTASAVRAINNATKGADTALAELDKLDNDYASMKGKDLADVLVKAGAKWTANTIMQELSRIRVLKKAGKWKTGMTSYQAREAKAALPKQERKKTTVANGVSKEAAEAATAKISREAPDTIASALIEAITASGVEDVLAEARRLITQAVNAKKNTK